MITNRPEQTADTTSAGRVVAMVAAGGLLALQAQLNGALATRIGSAVVAALVAYVIAVVCLLLGVVGRLQPSPVNRHRRGARLVRWPWWLGGLAGAAVVATTAATVAQAGVALVSVALVAGATAGGLLVDWLGWGPRGRQRPSPGRALGAGLAVAAVAAGTLGPHARQGQSLLIGLVLAAGVASAAQQAANGQLARVTGSVQVAALVSSLVAAIALAGWAGMLALAGRQQQLIWPTTWWLYTGGVAVALYGAIAAGAVRRLGVLVVTLASVSGQLLGSLVLDVAFPPPGGLRFTTILGALVTFLAAGLAARDGRQPTTAIAKPHPDRASPP